MIYPVPFSLAIKKLLEDEGGGQLVTDRGGLTRYGIAQKYNPDVDVANLTEAAAIDILYQRYFVELDLGKLAADANVNMVLIGKVFNLGVNLYRDSIVCLQRAVRAATAGKAVLKEDGAIGPLTVVAVSATAAAPMLAAFREAAAGEYRVRAAKDARDSEWLKGWLRRAYS